MLFSFWWYVEAFPCFAHQPWVGKYIIDVLNKSKYEIPDMQKQFYAVPFHHCTITNSMAKKILDSGIGDNFYLRNNCWVGEKIGNDSLKKAVRYRCHALFS